MNQILRVTLIRSTIGRPEKQRKIIRGLGLRKLHHSVDRPNCPSIRGMVAKVLHLVKVQELAADEEC